MENDFMSKRDEFLNLWNIDLLFYTKIYILDINSQKWKNIYIW